MINMIMIMIMTKIMTRKSLNINLKFQNNPYHK